MNDALNCTEEMIARTRRIETRVTRLCLHVGLDPTDGVPKVTLAGGSLAVTGYDVTLATLFAFCRKEGILGNILLTHNGKVIAQLSPETL
jgi:hypothetical protein